MLVLLKRLRLFFFSRFLYLIHRQQTICKCIATLKGSKGVARIKNLGVQLSQCNFSKFFTYKIFSKQAEDARKYFLASSACFEKILYVKNFEKLHWDSCTPRFFILATPLLPLRVAMHLHIVYCRCIKYKNLEKKNKRNLLRSTSIRKRLNLGHTKLRCQREPKSFSYGYFYYIMKPPTIEVQCFRGNFSAFRSTILLFLKLSRTEQCANVRAKRKHINCAVLQVYTLVNLHSFDSSRSVHILC